MRIRSGFLVSIVGAVVVSFVLSVIVWTAVRGNSGYHGDILEITAQQREEKGAIPRIVLPLGNEFDMGVLPNDRETVAEFPFRNEGQSTLEITKLSTECGCTMPTIPEKYKKTRPGEEGHVEILVDPMKVGGFDSSKRITLFTNDPLSPTCTVVVKCRFEPEFTLQPESFQFGRVEKGDTPSRTIILRQAGSQPVEVTRAEVAVNPEDFAVSVEKRPEAEWAQPGKPEFAITVQALPAVPIGILHGAVMVETTCKRLSNYRISITGDVTTFFTAEPSFLSAKGLAEPGQSNVAAMTIKADRPFEVADLKVSGTALAVSSRQEAGTDSAIIELSVAPDAKEGMAREQVSFVIKSAERAVPYAARAYVSVGKPKG